MKKVKRLVLCRETLRALDSHALGRAGGAAESIPVTCPTNCDITFGCPDLTRPCP
jgi:hypothetical protein